MTRLHFIPALLVSATLWGCARNYRLDDSPGVAPRHVFRLVWQKPLVAREFLDFRPQEWATAVIDSKERLYVGSSAGRFLALDARSGRRLWTLRAGGGISSRPLLDPERGWIYFGSDDGKLYAVDAKTGKLNWSYATQGTINRAPVVSEGFILFTSSEGRIYALDTDSGKWRWQYDREAPEGFTIHGYAGATVKGATVFTGFADGTLVALRVYSGDVVWTRSLKRDKQRFVDVDATPVLAGDLLLTTSYSGGIFAVSTENGSIRWQYPVEGASSLTVHNKRIYFTAPEAGVVALDLGGRLLWRQAIPKGVPSIPVASGPYLFITGTESGLFAVSARDGRLLQYFNPGHGISAPPTVGSGFLATLTNQGRLYVFQVPSRRASNRL